MQSAERYDCLDDDTLTDVIFKITGHVYKFAQAPVRIFGDKSAPVEYRNDQGPFYQLIPYKIDKGFFDWYYRHFPYRQFYKTKQDCALNFICNWYKWTDEVNKGNN